MKLLNPNCSTTITKIPVTDEEKEWIKAKIEELQLDKESAECFLSDTERADKVEDSKWMNEEHDATWTGFHTMSALLGVRREYITMDVKKITDLERKKMELESQRAVADSFITKASFRDTSTWEDIYNNLDKYFKLKKEVERADKREERKSQGKAKVL